MKSYGRWGIGSLTVLLATVSVLFLRSSDNTSSVQSRYESTPTAASVILACPGRVEGLSETTQLGAAVDGILKAVYVKEGQFVKRGTLLGEIVCDDLRAGLQTAIAEAEGARQARVRVLRGTRDEERRVASQKTAAARAVFEQAKSRLEMVRGLYEKQDISRAAYEEAVRDFGVAEADFQGTIRSEELLAAPPLQEEKARADAGVVAADGRVRTLQERIRKCSILAPIDGTVLRVSAKPGESFSTVTPRPLFSLADTSGRRIKAEIDERDVYRVAMGQNVLVLADALGEKKLSGSVVRISAMMGRKSVYTGDPSDKSDRDILEAVIELEDGARSLPIGLRVTVQFLSNGLPKK